MLPISGSVFGGALSFAARIANGEVDVDEETRQRAQELRWWVEETSELVGDLELDNPGSWGRTAGRAFDRIFDTHGLAESPREWREARGFTSAMGVGAELSRWICSSDAVEVREVFREGESGVCAVRLPGGSVVAVDVEYNGHLSVDAMYRPAGVDEGEIAGELATACWSDTRALRFEHDGKGLAFRSVDLREHQYRGDQVELIDTWGDFLSEGVSRNVLLQGAPGTGKTTLCCHAARELTERAILMTGTALKRVSGATWRRILDIVEPEVALVDDVDSVGGGSSGLGKAEHLQLFAELREEIPLLLFTSNDHTELPEALRRPGRIDRIVEFEEPSREVHLEMVREFAAEHDLEPDDQQVGWLADVLSEHSAAHVHEALRRASVLGWEAVDADEQTFRMHREYTDMEEWVRAGDYEKVVPNVHSIFGAAFVRGEPECGFRSKHRTLEVVELPNGVRVAREPSDGEQFGRHYWVRPSESEREGIEGPLNRGLKEMFWSDRGAVVAEKLEREIRFRGTEIGRREYFGPRRGLIDQWGRFLEAGHRRSVLLKGPPGTGKSTLCLQAADELSDRTVIMPSNVFESIAESDWRSVSERLDPEAVVVDDVDRAGNHSLEQTLRLIEERYCTVPLLLFTCNEPDDLPRPMRRPGRIDQIVEFDTPGRARRESIARELADREGVEVPDERVDRVVEVLREQSAAHAREMLRRADVLGWDRVEDVPGDETFAAASSDGEGAADRGDSVLSGAAE